MEQYDKLYEIISTYTSKIKNVCEDAYRNTTNEDEKRIIDAVWDNASHIDLLLCDAQSQIDSGTVPPSTYKAIERGSHNF